jgi:hypothetical protein
MRVSGSEGGKATRGYKRLYDYEFLFALFTE